MPWAACCLAFYGFSRAGKLTVPSDSSFDVSVYLAWGDVGVDDQVHPSVLSIILKASKTDSFWQGITLFIWRVSSDLCPESDMLAYLLVQGCHPWPPVCLPGWLTFDSPKVRYGRSPGPGVCRSLGCSLCRSQLPHGGSHNSCDTWDGGLPYQDCRSLEEAGVLRVRQDSAAAASLLLCHVMLIDHIYWKSVFVVIFLISLLPTWCRIMSMLAI